MKEYKIISKHSWWSSCKVKSDIEKVINKYAQNGWKVVSVSFSYYGYYAFATLEREVIQNEFV
jgi:hypothetical protein